MVIKSLTRIISKGKAISRGLNAGAKLCKKPLFHFNGASGMRRAAFATIGTLGAAGVVTSCSEEDFFHEHTMDHDAEVNFKLIDIPTKTEYITKTDTLYQDRVVRDTLCLPGDTVIQDRVVHDTTYVDRPIYIEVPGEQVILPDTLKPEPDPIIDDFTHNVLDQGNDTTGVTIRIQGNKEYEQLFGCSTLVPSESTNKKMVFKTFNNYYEDPENPTKYYTRTEVSVGTLDDGRKGLYVSSIPAYAGFNFGSYSGAEQNWNRALAKNELIVKSSDGKHLERYTRNANGSFVYAGIISAKDQKILQDKHILPEGNQTWEQKITNFETESAVLTKKPGEEWH